MTHKPIAGSARLSVSSPQPTPELDLSKIPDAPSFSERLEGQPLAGHVRRQGHEEDRYVGERELKQRYPVSTMTRWRWGKDPDVAFPKPVKLGRNGRNFWWLPDIIEWELRRAASTSQSRPGRGA
jgi:predicted DNA-binding transcriptional regulator AlpA